MNKLRLWHGFAFACGHTDTQARLVSDVELGRITEEQAELLDQAENDLQALGLRVIEQEIYLN